MAEAFIQLPPDSTGKALRTQTGGPNAAHMEVHVLAGSDGTMVSAGNGGALATSDIYSTSEYLADQTGAAGVLTFTFSSAVQLVYLHAKGGDVRYSAGGTPSASLGGYCSDGETVPYPRQTSVLNVYAPTGVVCSVWGARY